MVLEKEKRDEYIIFIDDKIKHLNLKDRNNIFTVIQNELEQQYDKKKYRVKNNGVEIPFKYINDDLLEKVYNLINNSITDAFFSRV